MRVCVIGAGIAGTLLAWRLSETVDVDLVTGPPGTDATAASGGGVRGFETHPVQRRLAIDSLTELFESLQEEAGYTETGCTYLLPSYAGLEGAVAEVEEAHPGSTEILDRNALRRKGWHGLPEGTVGVCERRAGFIRPDQLRRAVLRHLAAGARSRVADGPVVRLAPHPDGSVSCRLPRQERAVRRRRGSSRPVDTRPADRQRPAGRALPNEGDPDRHLLCGRRPADHVRG